MRAMLAAVMLAIGLMTGVPTRAQQPPSASQEYVPVDRATQQEQLPAAPLVMGAYAVVWVAVVLYLWSIWRRLNSVEREIAQVNRRIEREGRR